MKTQTGSETKHYLTICIRAGKYAVNSTKTKDKKGFITMGASFKAPPCPFFLLRKSQKILSVIPKLKTEIMQKSISQNRLKRVSSVALSFCMRSTPITLVLLSFPHNHSLSLYSPLLNWSILHLNQDISTLQLEKEGENKQKQAF